MTRPESVADLDEHERAPHEFVKVDLQHLTRDVTVGAAVLNLIEAARSSEHFSVDEDGLFVVSVPLTEAELQRKVESAQRSWDYTQTDYHAARDGAKHIESWRRHGIDRWARDEAQAPIDWAAHDETFEGVKR